jgi:hypothetical protein
MTGMQSDIVSEVAAAAMLDLNVIVFRVLVRNGYLPEGGEVETGERRWNIKDLRMNAALVAPYRRSRRARREV